GQSFRQQQSLDKVAVIAGETLTLACNTSGYGPPGPVKWVKGWGSENKTVYEQKGSFPRVTRVLPGSHVDYSIRIGDVRPEDSGSYYCVKTVRFSATPETVVLGKGIEVSVRARPSIPVIFGPSGRMEPGDSVPFGCMSIGFSPKEINVKWFKDRTQISSQLPQVTPERWESSFTMSSSVTLMLQKDDVRSQVVCEVQHPTLPAPLRSTYQLGKVLRVSPSVRVAADSQSSIRVNKTLNFTCYVEGFYPGDAAVTWLENGLEIKVENISRPRETSRGLFELTSLVEVQATEERNGSEFTCRVVHDGQSPISGKSTLWIPVLPKDG
ncbi:SHPS1 phosphatase, partial [Todus mexicanus]|nr:SHPS1 phosphatase [Todus mexicanus]